MPAAPWLDAGRRSASGCPALGAGAWWGWRWGGERQALQSQVEAGRGRLAWWPQTHKHWHTRVCPRPWLTGARNMRVHTHAAHQGAALHARKPAGPERSWLDSGQPPTHVPTQESLHLARAPCPRPKATQPT